MLAMFIVIMIVIFFKVVVAMIMMMSMCSVPDQSPDKENNAGDDQNCADNMTLL
jgi:flagellar basal body-associated protein FliL